MGEVECRQIRPLPLGEPKGKETASRKTCGNIEVKGESANTCLLDIAVLESLKLLQRQLFRSLEDWEVSLLQFMHWYRN
ncbi:hypothetical protein Tco_1480008 [Tanacetum coccineum]